VPPRPDGETGSFQRGAFPAGKDEKMMGVTWWMVLVLLGGGGYDLLDLVSSKAYWQAQSAEMTVESLLSELRTPEGEDVSELIKKLGAQRHQDREEAHRKLLARGPSVVPDLLKAAETADAETAARINDLVRSLSGKAGAPAVRRLMAIRGLGELKDGRALPALRKLAASKALFEAEYVRRAIAGIEGKPFKPSDVPAGAMASDLWLLPGNCGAVGQARLQLGKQQTAEEMIRGLAGMLPAGGAEEAVARINQSLISVAQRVGNVRICGVTWGVADNIGTRAGYVVVVARGLYDAGTVRRVLLEQQAKPEDVGGTEVLRLGGETCLLLASNERLVLMVGPSREQLPVGEVAAAVRAGKGKLAGNEPMAALVKSIDAAAPIWAVARVSQTYREASLLAAFQDLTFQAKRQADQLDFTLKARGTDPVKVQAAVEEFNKLMAEGRDQTARQAERMPPLKPLAELIGSIKAQADGADATVTGRLKGDLNRLSAIPFVISAAVRLDRPPPPPRAVRPAPAPQ
jgi:hypothetical protein